MLLDEHKRFIGGSDIASIMGIGWGSPLEVYQRIAEGIDSPENDLMEMGNLIEPWARKIFERDFLVRVHKPPTSIIEGRYRISPDGFIQAWEDPHPVWECKWTGIHNRKLWGPEGTDRVPEHYIWQAQWYMGWTGARSAHVSVVIGGPPTRYYQLRFSQKLFDRARAAADRFWEEHVVPRRAPELTFRDAERAEAMDGGLVAPDVELEASEALAKALAEMDQIAAKGRNEGKRADLLRALVFSVVKQNAKVETPSGLYRVARGEGYDRVDWRKVAAAVQGHVPALAWKAAVEMYTTRVSGKRTVEKMEEE